MSSFQEMIRAIHEEGFLARLPSVGLSMYPAIETGDRVVLKGLGAEGPEVGEIIGVRSEDGVFCHRLVGKFKKDGTVWYQTRGDSHLSKDAPISREQIIGKVVGVETGGNMSLRRSVLLGLDRLRRGFPLICAVVFTVLISVMKMKGGRGLGPVRLHGPAERGMEMDSVSGLGD
jgi:hypothetical protein